MCCIDDGRIITKIVSSVTNLGPVFLRNKRNSKAPLTSDRCSASNPCPAAFFVCALSLLVSSKRTRPYWTFPKRGGLLQVDSRCALVSIPTLSKEPLLMSNVFSSKAAQLWAERIAQCERSNLSNNAGTDPVQHPQVLLAILSLQRGHRCVREIVKSFSDQIRACFSLLCTIRIVAR